MSNNTIQNILILALLFPSVVLHEIAHGYAALRLGDPTARDAGRLSLNPLKHIDVFGTVLLPLMMFAMGGPIFGYAKPVPINPNYFKDIRKGDLITGLAGPLTNLALALVGALIYRGSGLLPGGLFSSILGLVGFAFVEVNLVLMFFNLIPIPPLDGSSIWPIFLSDSALRTYYSIQRYSFAILLVLLWVVPSFTSFNPIGGYFNVTVIPVVRLLVG